MNESDPRSDMHYLGSSENKAWKKFRPVRDMNKRSNSLDGFHSQIKIFCSI